MKKHFWIFLIYFPLFMSAQLKSPAEFLGYNLGEKYTPHYKIVNYFNYVATLAPKSIKLEKYGETYEGRPLYLAFISAPSNITNLETIRKNNLQLAGLEKGNAKNTALPIVWLSYNVHGNEPSSSEAAMNTLYELLREDKSTENKILENTIVIIDPCLNPDGRDRYVNWFNSMLGSNANAKPFAREHQEPWPGGRVNHYNFDLNRDWAWQTQIETQQRIKVYQQWMPQVHIDYHEQGYNEPYYFAPAAEPFHEVITPWQKDFQIQIGKNNAKKFDEQGWLYFTKERFDLFYPSYGDTYPTYNGSIGMTYEQGGHSRGGLAVIVDEGDTLTLKDRIAHHTATGLTTIATTSLNAEKVIGEYKKYFDNAKAGGSNGYKSYVISTNDLSRINAVKNILQINGIDFANVSASTKLTGYNYFSNKNENVNLQQFSIAINTNQPRSALAKVLLEPTSKLTDSATYDITAWSLPYAYGVNAYGVSSFVQSNNSETIGYAKIENVKYGVAIKYSSVHDATLLAALLNNNAGVRVNEKDITYKAKKISKGSLLVLKRDNANWQKVVDIINTHGAVFTVLDGGFVDAGPDMGSPDIIKLASPRIACLTGEGVDENAAGEVWHLFDQQIKYPLTMINANSLRINSLKQLDVIILPNGNYDFIIDKKTAEDVKTWVRNGGRIIALDNAVTQMAGADWGIKLKKTDDEKKEDKKLVDYSDLKKYGNKERDDLVNSIPGAIYKIEMDDTHPLAFGIGSTFYTLKQNSNVLEFLKDGWNVGVVKKENKISGFAGEAATKLIKDGTVFGVQEVGRGKIIYLLDNPIFRNFWENGKMLFLNAAFMVGNEPERL
jgi:Zinc carboxypeptidase